MSADFVKIYPGFFKGSLRDTPPFARLLFLGMITEADENGLARGTISFWAAYIGCSKEDVEASLEILSSPDPDSNSAAEEGRRIVRWGDGAHTWRIVNYAKYFEKSRNEDRANYKREWDRKHAETRHVSGSKRPNPTKPDKPDHENENENENNTPPTPSKKGIALSDILEPIRSTIEEFIQHRKNLKKPLTPEAIKRQLAKFEEWGAAEAKKRIEVAIESGWMQAYPPKEGEGPKRKEPKHDLVAVPFKNSEGMHDTVIVEAPLGTNADKSKKAEFCDEYRRKKGLVAA